MILFGQVTETTDPLGNVVTYAYDKNGNRDSEPPALGSIPTNANDVVRHLSVDGGVRCE